jgi:hypothetical protein
MAQPNMGKRKLYAIRPPADLALALEKKIARDRLGRSRSVYINDLLADRYGLRRPSERFRTKSVQPAQAELALGKGVRRRRQPVRPRELYSPRVPLDIAAALDQEIADQGPDVSANTFLTDLLAEHCDMQLPSKQARPGRATAVQQEVGLGIAS